MTTAITEYSKTDAALAELAGRYKGKVYDVATREGMDEARTDRALIRGYRVDLEKVRVEIKAPALERCRLIDAEAKRITAALEELEGPIDLAIKSEEKRKEREAMERAMAEQRRKDGIQARIAAIRQIPSACVGKRSQDIAVVLNEAQARVIGADYDEFRVEAEDALKSTLAQLSVMLSGTQAQEAEAERAKADREDLAKRRAEQDERERASRIKIERTEQESRARIAEEERVARHARAAEEARLHAEREAAEAERRRMDAAQREIDRKANEVMDAHGMLATFKQRFGHIKDFAPVVAAIDSIAPKRARRVA